MKIRKKKKIIESLLGFYQVVATFYNNSVQYDDEAVRGLMIHVHLGELFNYHKEKATTYKIPIPEVKEFYKEYINGWNEHIKTKEPMLNDIIKIYVDKKCDYII